MAKEKEEVPVIVCRICGNDKTVGIGTCLTKKWGTQNRRQCKRCASTFYTNWKLMKDTEGKQ